MGASLAMGNFDARIIQSISTLRNQSETRLQNSYKGFSASILWSDPLPPSLVSSSTASINATIARLVRQ